MEFLEINDNGEVSDSTLWESLKVTMRGLIISFETSRKKAKFKRQKEIEQEMMHLEQIHKTSLLQSDYNKILKLKSEYNSILGGEISTLLFKTRQKHFELSDKPQKLLSRQLKSEQSKTAIYKIQSSNGQILTDLQDINNEFKEFYSWSVYLYFHSNRFRLFGLLQYIIFASIE